MEDYTPGWNFEGSSFTVKTGKCNLDGVAGTLHHIFPLFEIGLRWGTRVFSGRSQPDLRMKGLLCVVVEVNYSVQIYSSIKQHVHSAGPLNVK